jgi:hypothetical protein
MSEMINKFYKSDVDATEREREGGESMYKISLLIYIKMILF